MLDGEGRLIKYLRLSVTDRCNCRCTYCMPAGGVPMLGHRDILSFEGLTEVVAACAQLGVRKVRLTGGEPLLQIDSALIDALHARGFTIAVETNGTIAAPPGLDWVCVSPKAGSELVVRKGHELKLVYPQAENAPEDFAGLEFERFSLQPLDGPDIAQSTQAAIAYCLAHPQWRLSVQTHKTLGIR